jgi:hypothetical protein
MNIVNEVLQYGDKTEWTSSQNNVQPTPTNEDLSDPLALVVKQEEASPVLGFICLCTPHCSNSVQKSNVYSVVE